MPCEVVCLKTYARRTCTKRTLLWLGIRTYGQFRILSISTVIVWKTRLSFETTHNPTYEIYFRHLQLTIVSLYVLSTRGYDHRACTCRISKAVPTGRSKTRPGRKPKLRPNICRPDKIGLKYCPPVKRNINQK